MIILLHTVFYKGDIKIIIIYYKHFKIITKIPH